MKKKNAAVFALAFSAMLLAGCGDGKTPEKSSGEKVTSSVNTNNSSATTISSAKEVVKLKVNINGTESEVDYGSKLLRPADPVAPAGKKFYGWKNTLNGGQIWDFEHDDLNIVLSNVNLEPCFVDASLDPQLFEAELCPDITAIYGGELGMPGATYSGGQQGKGLICHDFEGETGATGAWFEGAEEKAFVHFMYVKGDTLTWEVESDVAASDVTIFARFSAEYGIMDPLTDERYSTISDTSFPITVNGEAIKYGNIKFHNIPEIGRYLTFQDYFLSSTVSLKAGTNIIQMKVDNLDTLNGTIASSAPCVDSIKLYSTSEVTWNKGLLSNLEMD